MESSDTRESHWQAGCADARADREPQIPFPMAVGYHANLQNNGYMNGWKFGRTQPRHQPTEDEGSQP